MTESSMEHEWGACGSKRYSLKVVHLKFTLWVKWWKLAIRNECSFCLPYQGARAERSSPEQLRSQLDEIKNVEEYHTYQSEVKVQLGGSRSDWHFLTYGSYNCKQSGSELLMRCGM